MAKTFALGWGPEDGSGFPFDNPVDPGATGIHYGYISDELQGTAPGSQSGVIAIASTSQTVTFAGSGIVFNNTYTANVTLAYKNCILAAEQDIATHWTNSITINVTFDALAKGTNSFLASNGFGLVENISYATLKNALAAHAGSADAQAAVASLPATDPSGGLGWALPVAYARMLGITSIAPATDDTVTLNTSYNWSYGQDVTAAVEHELSEGGMGRIGALGKNTDNGGNTLWSTMDLFRYSASGVRDYSDGQDGQTAYFSVDGNQLLLPFNNQYSGSTRVNNGDTADYNVLDMFGFGSPGDSLTLSTADIENMNVLGWTPAGDTQAPTITNDNPLSIPVGATLTITPSLLSATDNVSSGASLVYTVTASPTHGVLIMNGLSTTSFTQADVNNGLVSYHETAAGATSDVFSFKVTDAAGNATGTALFQISISNPAAREDFNGDGHSDVLWWNNNGAVSIWDSGQPGGAHSVAAAGTIASSSHIVGTGDFDGNGHSDILWQDDNGTVSIWDNGQIGGAHVISGAGVVASSWHIAATGDFDGNGHDDILWHNDNGAVSIWDNGQIGSAHIISAAGVVASSWHIAGTGDFDGNGHSDILWRNDNGAVSIWDNGQIGAAHIIANAGVVASSWHIVGTGDFDGNGHSDILWQNDNGAVSIWDNGQIGSAHIISGAGNVASSWHIATTGDFDGNGHSDILWRNDNGAVSIWDNGQIGAAHIVANAGAMLSDWHIA
jgi:hypothetical protein